MIDVYRAVYNLSAQIPSGRVSTYKALAEALGDANVARAVGRILNENPKPIIIPCHRVVHQSGELGGYKFGVDKKASLLRSEGIKIENYKIKNFREIIFRNFKTSYPLKKLRALQKKLARRVILEDRFKKLDVIGGVDVSYYNNSGTAACATFDYRTKKILGVRIVKKKVNFPYIPTYLAFRELPAIKEVVNKLIKKPDILMIDGNGILHPLGIGIASHVGVVMNIPTIGVAKTLLCGKVERMPLKVGESSKIFYKKRVVGFCLKSATYAKPIYVSPGNKVSLATALKIVRHFSISRIPEPLRLADSMGRKIRLTMKIK